MNKKPLFQKIFSRDFCIIFCEIGAWSECRDDKPWLDTVTPYKPYMLIERNDGTCNIWYNTEGVKWTNNILKAKVQSDHHFLKEVELQVRKGIVFMRSIYEEEKTLDRRDLLRFINQFLTAYPWIEAMWWIKSMKAQELGVDHTSIVNLRNETETLSAKTDVVIRKSLEKLYPELGTLSSMIQFKEFRSNTIPSKLALRKRMKGFLLVDGKLILSSLSEFAKEKKIELALPLIEKNATVLKGQTGSSGKVQGVVCRVMGHGDFGKIKKGQILVSPMTMIDFFPEMEKAAAIVTDEGGILCHAAIVAREMKKPCVVGTQIATKILKDGDLVEVNATDGLVKILSRT